MKATCTVDGKSVRTCKACKEEEVLGTVQAGRHNYTSVTTRKATYDQPGLITKTCGDVRTEEIPKLASAARHRRPVSGTAAAPA